MSDQYQKETVDYSGITSLPSVKILLLSENLERLLIKCSKDYKNCLHRVELLYGGAKGSIGEDFGRSLNAIFTACDRLIADVVKLKNESREAYTAAITTIDNIIAEDEAFWRRDTRIDPPLLFEAAVMEIVNIRGTVSLLLNERRGGRVPTRGCALLYVYHLARIFLKSQKLNEKKLPAYYDNSPKDANKQSHGGALVDLVDECFKFLGEARSNSTIVGLIKEVLPLAKKRENQAS